MIYRLNNIEGGTSSHIGSICRVAQKLAKIGEDYGLANLLAIETQMSVAVESLWDKTLYKVVLFYDDGYYRDLGVKAVIETADGDLILYGHSTVYHLTKEEE